MMNRNKTSRSKKKAKSNIQLSPGWLGVLIAVVLITVCAVVLFRNQEGGLTRVSEKSMREIEQIASEVQYLISVQSNTNSSGTPNKYCDQREQGPFDDGNTWCFVDYKTTVVIDDHVSALKIADKIVNSVGRGRDLTVRGNVGLRENNNIRGLYSYPSKEGFSCDLSLTGASNEKGYTLEVLNRCSARTKKALYN